MKKKWKIGFGVLVLIGLIAFVVTQMLETLEVEVKEVQPEFIKHAFTEDGIVKSAEERAIIPIHSGKIKELLVEEGDRVQSGDLLAVLDGSELRYTLEELEAQLGAIRGEEMKLTEEPGEAEIDNIKLAIQRAEDNLETAQKAHDRVETIYNQGFATDVELEEAQNRVADAEFNLKQQEKSLDVLRASYDPPRGSREIIDAQKQALQAQMNSIMHRLEDYQINAPIAGVIKDLEVDEGGVASPGRPLMVILAEDEYLVESRVLTRDIVDLTEGMGVGLTFEQRDGDREFRGEVTEIKPYAERDMSPLGLEEERVTIKISPDIPEDLSIAPGYKLEVEFTTAERHDKLVVPKTTLFTYEGEDALFVVEAGQLAVRKVTTGFETRQDIVIAEGLRPGDKVVLDPDKDGLEEGVSVSYAIIE